MLTANAAVASRKEAAACATGAGEYGFPAGTPGGDRHAAAMRDTIPCLVRFVMAMALAGGGLAAVEAPHPELWVYCPVNLLVDANVDRLGELFARAGRAGYRTVLLADSKFGKLGDLDARYFANLERTKALAAANHLRIVPAVFPIGYSNDILWNDPDLAEAIPVRDALFVVSGGQARLQPEPAVALPGGAMADLKRWSWKDDLVVADQGAALMRDPAGRNARLCQTVAVHPFRQYHVSVRVKTADFHGTPEIKALAGDRSLSWSALGVKPTQDWTVHHAVFNSLGNAKVNVYLGCWDGGTGSLWWKDAAIEEVGLLNLVRRPGAPFEVRLDGEGGRVLGEGTDYQAVRDPLMGTVPWKGAYDVWHQPPTIACGLPDGTRLRVSWHHVVTVGDGQVMICPSEPKTVELLRDQARRLHAAWKADAYFMSHDEIRVLGWDAACTRRGLTPGAILADNAKTCTGILQEVNPGGTIYVWSDMFDPGHNAHDDYYLVNGDLAGSWEGLDKTVVAVLWNFGKRRESAQWFAGRGHPLVIAGYYDGDPAQVREWMAAVQDVPGVQGIIYTTWRNDYTQLERFAELVRGGR
jgi:hypothetical protein